MIVTPCACSLFVSKVTKITRYMDVCFWWSFFGAFSVCDDCILKSTTAWLLKLSVLYIHSFMQVHNTTFQIKTVFNNVLFSTEMHNALHAHLLALSHVYLEELFPRSQEVGEAALSVSPPEWFCIKMGSGKNHLNVSLIVRGEVTKINSVYKYNWQWHKPQHLKRKESCSSGVKLRSICLPA